MKGSLFDSIEGPDLSLPADPVWHRLTSDFMASPQGVTLTERLREAEERGAEIYPPRVFRAFDETPFESVKVVILGQDPYHGPGQAEGLAFSVPAGIRVPPSLRNIKKELCRDLGLPVSADGSLIAWSRQGVLLLNAILTVESGKAASHRNWGWEKLTDEAISLVSERSAGCVFMLWGNFAQTKRSLIDEGRHLVLTANHPSPLSALRPPVPFIGCGHFSEANRWLQAHGREPINWQC